MTDKRLQIIPPELKIFDPELYRTDIEYRQLCDLEMQAERRERFRLLFQ